MTSTERDATSAAISDYDSYVQAAAAAGHPAIQAFSPWFKALASTAGISAIDHTGTTHTSAEPGVPIYWLDGERVAADYADLYDGTWNSRNPRNEAGSSRRGLVWTGSRANGSQSGSHVLGRRESTASTGNPSSSRPLNSGTTRSIAEMNYLYGLSPVFVVEAQSDPSPIVGSVAITPNPGTDETYRAGDHVGVTVSLANR